MPYITIQKKKQQNSKETKTVIILFLNFFFTILKKYISYMFLIFSKGYCYVRHTLFNYHNYHIIS